MVADEAKQDRLLEDAAADEGGHKQVAMNRYGQRAMQHWQEWLPDRLRELEDVEAFFTELGERAAEEIDALAEELRVQYPDVAGYQEQVAQRETAARMAENQVMRDLVLVDPEDEDKIAQLIG